MTGSSDIYGRDRRPSASIDLVTVHDGFTLADLTSYNVKHNEANGEGNRDGTDDNRSWNCGAEGPTDDPQVLGLRAQQRRNLLATLLLSEGVPLILGGDELGRTQGGNNNAYCQDNPTSWVDWSASRDSHELIDFVASLCRLRHGSKVLKRRRFFREDEIEWLRPDGEPMSAGDWTNPGARAVAAASQVGGFVLLVNGWWEPLSFSLPSALRTKRLSVSIDTSPAPAGAAIGPASEISLDGRSLMLLRPTP